MSNWGNAGLESSRHEAHCRRYHGAADWAHRWSHAQTEGAAAALGKWTLREEDPKYAPDRTCDVEHLKLELEVDLPKQSLEARATLSLFAAYGPFSEIVLDAVDLDLHSVTDGKGREHSYSYIDRRLTVSFKPAVKERVELVIAYAVAKPSEGLYFVGPSRHEPNAVWQLWSQGQDEEARHWIPCHDAPHERMTTELIVTTAAQHTVISNGALLSVKARGKKKTWHYREATPYPSYLISLVVGEFVKVEDQWKGIPVEYFVEPGREKEARRSFGKTPKMLDFFSSMLDLPYPYEKYAQVAVRHFIFGGMENLSATTQTDNTLHDERAALDFTSDELVAHELAHQWFGDLVTCESWAHAWLNEGFATYFDALFKEHDLGRDEFDYQMVLNAEDYLAEPYRRPIVSHRYAHPFQLFDAHLYPKGAWVLHMLRRRLGDDLFWKAIRVYVKRHAQGSVETLDLIRAFEQTSGKSLQSFFQQWLYSPGHPDLSGDLSWDGDARCVCLNLKQGQNRDNGTPIFRLKLQVDTRLENGNVVTRVFEMDQATQTFYLQLPSKPVWVALDPEGAILRTTVIKRPLEWLEACLRGKARDPRVIARVDAVRQAGEQAGQRATTLLARVLLEDPFWGVQAEAASALGRLRSPAALEALLAGLRAKHPKTRRAVVSALGVYQEPSAVAALRGFVTKPDPSYHVQLSALAALGRAAGKDAVSELRAQLKLALKRKDWHDLLAQCAALGLAQTREEEVADDIIALIDDRARYWGTRSNTIVALADLAAARPRIGARVEEQLVRHLDDPDLLVAQRVPNALVRLGRSSVLPALRRKADTTADPHLRESCLMAADELASQATKTEATDALRGELDKLRAETRELRQRLDKSTEAGRRRP